jgi:hypothetical protein
MLGPKLHDAANLVIAESFGWVVDGDTTVDVLGARVGAAGRSGS